MWTWFSMEKRAVDVEHVNLDFVLQKAVVNGATGYGEAMEGLMEH